MTKAQDFLQAVTEAEWIGELVAEETHEIVIARGPGSVLTLVWVGNSYSYPQSSYVNGAGNERKIRNASEALRIIANGGSFPRSKVTTSLDNGRAVVTTGITSKGSSSDEDEYVHPLERAKNLPFHLGSSSEAIVTAVRGKIVTWYNSKMRSEESAQVMNRNEQKFLRIEMGKNRRRVLVFAEGDPVDPRMAGGGFRSIYLDAIVRVK